MKTQLKFTETLPLDTGDLAVSVEVDKENDNPFLLDFAGIDWDSTHLELNLADLNKICRVLNAAKKEARS